MIGLQILATGFVLWFATVIIARIHVTEDDIKNKSWPVAILGLTNALSWPVMIVGAIMSVWSLIP